jgi:hypothetical protein
MSPRLAVLHTWRSGFCGTGWHFDCRGTYGPVDCSCHCHDAPPPVPAPTVVLEPVPPPTCTACGQALPRSADG